MNRGLYVYSGPARRYDPRRLEQDRIVRPRRNPWDAVVKPIADGIVWVFERPEVLASAVFFAGLLLWIVVVLSLS